MGADIKRRIVLFLDGTWNEDANDAEPSSNVVRLREALKLGVDELLNPKQTVREGARAQGSTVPGGDKGADLEYVVYYDRGVGTGAWSDHLWGGATGDGLDRNVRQAYRFLSHHYRPGDEIFIFGFSRGSFTARSLAGFLFATGLLRSTECTEANEAAAWNYYRHAPNDRFCGEWFRLQAFMHPYRDFSIRCLGVFDTVGALGVPLEGFRTFNRERYEFHNTELSSIVDVSLHAVAIDEPRWAFQAALWQKPKFKHYSPDAVVEQIWFPGAHADVGGGYTWWDRGQSGLQDLPFDWMLSRAKAHTGIHFADPDALGSPAVRIDRSGALEGMVHRPWRFLDPIRAPASRYINQIQPLPGERIRPLGRMPHADPIGEAIHVSALRLLRKSGIPREGISGIQPYRPANLRAALPYVAETYRQPMGAQQRRLWDPRLLRLPAGAPPPLPLFVVGDDGRRVEPGLGSPALDEVLDLLGDPKALGVS